MHAHTEKLHAKNTVPVAAILCLDDGDVQKVFAHFDLHVSGLDAGKFCSEFHVFLAVLY